MQYSLTNVNAFIIIITIGYITSYSKKKNNSDILLEDKSNSPLQYISQLKGHYYINPLLAISFTIVMYSFVGIPPLIGFFGKQMVLSSALDKGYIFITLVAILTSVISAVYYLNIVKEIFFSKPEPSHVISMPVIIYYNERKNILATSLAATIAILTLIILLFMANPDQWLGISNILAILMFN